MNESDGIYAWQDEAIQAWADQGCRGIIEAFPGSGKTNVAFKAMQHVWGLNKRVSVLVVVPTIPLMNQWYESIQEVFPDLEVGLLGGGYQDDFSKGRTGALPGVVIAVVNSAVNQVFPNCPPDREHDARTRGLLAHCLGGDCHSLLVADECHHYIFEDLRRNNRILWFPFTYTMGLSATIDPNEVEGLGTIAYTHRMKPGLVPAFDVINVPMPLTTHERE